jgi:hypothetical protein
LLVVAWALIIVGLYTFKPIRIQKIIPRIFSIAIASLAVGLVFYWLAWDNADRPTQRDASVRVKYSSRQTVQCSIYDPNQIINLDNIATLTLWTCGKDSAEFLMSKSGSRSVSHPQTNEKYEVGGGFTVEFPSAGDGKIDILDSKILTGPVEEYRFSMDERDKSITVNGRVFRVHLDQINGTYVDGKHQFSYVFAVSEE